MKRFAAILVLILPALCSFAQADTIHLNTPKDLTPMDEPLASSPFIRKGILGGVATVGVGEMPMHNISNVYVTGNLEYYAEQRVSIRGDAYFFVNSLVQNSHLIQNSSVYFGAYYHFPIHGSVGHFFDPLIGFQPGVAFARTNDSTNGKSDPGAISPLMSVITGFNFFGEKWFNIQLNIRYTVGQESTEQSQFNLDEISFNFGLGFNIYLIKKHHPFTTTDQNSSW